MIQKIKIGNVELKNNIFLAPMAGISDTVYRQIMREHGAGLVYSEMVSAAGLMRRNKKTFELLKFAKKERPFAVQLFGNKPQEFAEAAQILEEETAAAIIDINMGCPVKKVVQSGSGSALMKDLVLAKEIIQAAMSKIALPVTVKFRSGWDNENINFLELGKICEECGVAAVALHPRTRAQAYQGQADWEKIKQLKAAVAIPVIGSGDINSVADAQAMFQQTGCDAVMLGRGAMGNPWLFEGILNGAEIEKTPPERIALYLEHTRRYLAAYPDLNEEKGVSIMRKFAHRYISGFDGAAKIRQEINVIKSYAELEAFLAS